MQTSIEFDGFEGLQALRDDLVAFISRYCAEMTLAEAKEALGLNVP